MSPMLDISKAFTTYDKLENRQLVGDLGVGMAIGGLICLGLHIGGITGSIWNVPFPVIYGVFGEPPNSLLQWFETKGTVVSP